MNRHIRYFIIACAIAAALAVAGFVMMIAVGGSLIAIISGLTQ